MNTSASPGERVGKGETESRETLKGCCNYPRKGRGGFKKSHRAVLWSSILTSLLCFMFHINYFWFFLSNLN
jgi:hypothetical protein